MGLDLSTLRNLISRYVSRQCIAVYFNTLTKPHLNIYRATLILSTTHFGLSFTRERKTQKPIMETALGANFVVDSNWTCFLLNFLILSLESTVFVFGLVELQSGGS